MHIQDGYLSPEVCAATVVVSAAAVGFSLHRLRDALADRTIPVTGMMASLIFAGQMVNFPLPGAPVSGHLLGGVLAATVVGPWAGCVAMSLVLIAQWAMFSDGGLTALGANILHMGVVGSMGGYAVMTTVRKLLGGGLRATVTGAVVAAWLSVMAAAALFCVEFRLSHAGADFDFQNMFLLMVTLHSGIGMGEALITGFAVGVIAQQRPDLVADEPAREAVPGTIGRFLIAGLVAALAVGAFLAPFASSSPDGLDAVADRFGIAASAPTIPGAFADYDALPLSSWQALSVSIAGIGGSLTVFVAAVLLGRMVPARRTALVEVARE